MYLDTSGTSVTVAGNGDTVNSSASGNVVGLTGANDIAQVSDGQIYTNTTSAGSLTIQGSGDTETTISGTTQGAPALTAQTNSDIDAIYNAVLDRDVDPAGLVAAQIVLADGGGLSGVMSAVANSAEAQADMASTYAAVGGTGPVQAQLDAQPQSTSELLNVGDVQDQVTSAPTQTEFNAFADAMSTSYGAPVELFSVDPASGAETELADTSVTNLLAELPVLETQANGANLGLQLADGTQVQFASTARTATFLYSLAVQQMQATSFVTDNYNLDMQWLNTVDQPLLDEAGYWSERATAEASAKPEAAVEDNTQASMALQIAAEAPASRQDMSVTIKNAATGNPTQITVYADGDGSTIHDVAPSVLGYVETVVSTVIDIAAVVTGQAYLYFAAAAIDAAEAGQAFSNGQDIQGILSLAQAVSAGIAGGAGGTTPLGTTATAPLTSAQVTAQVINTAVQGVGGVYGVVQSAENGNAVGMLAGALEAAAAAATGIGMYEGGETQAVLSALAAGLGTAGLATTVAGDFASGNLGQGLVDSLNLYLPAVAQAYANDQSGQNAVQGVLQTNPLAFAAASGNPAPDSSGVITQLSAPILIPSDSVGLTTTVDGQTGTTTVGVVSTANGASTLGIEEQPAPNDTNQNGFEVAFGPPGTTSGSQSLSRSALLAFVTSEADPSLAASVASAPLPPTVAVVDGEGTGDLTTLQANLSTTIGQTLDGTAKTVGLALEQDVYDLASQLAATIKQSVFGSGLAPDLSGQHGYLYQEGMQFTTAQEASQYMLNHPGPGVDYSAQGGVTDKQKTTLFGDDTIVTNVFENGMHIQNATEAGHIFGHGTVDRYVMQNDNGTYSIYDFGKGSGLLPTLNNNIAPFVFGDFKSNLTNGHLILMK